MTSILTFAKIAMRNLLSPPVTTKYPFEPATYPEGSRGHIELDLEQCIFCGMCSRKCPTGAITVDRKTGNWTIARFDCVQCANCVNGCPKKCLTIVPGYFAPGTEKVSETFRKDLPQPKPRPKPAAKPAPAAAPAAPKAPAAAPAASAAAPETPAAPKPAPETAPAPKPAPEAAPAPEVTPAPAPAPEAAPEEDGGPRADLTKCKFCGLCARKCPNECITVDRKAKTWTVRAEDCVGCGVCQSVCHFEAIELG